MCNQQPQACGKVRWRYFALWSATALTLLAGAALPHHGFVLPLSAAAAFPSEPTTANELVCWLDPPVEPTLLQGGISGGTPPYRCEAFTTSPGWVIDTCEAYGPIFIVTCRLVPPTGCGQAFDVTVIVTDADGRQTSCSEVILPPPGDCSVEPAFQEICAGQQARFCATAFGAPPMTYHWTGPEGFTAETACIEVGTEGSYEVVGIDAFGCLSVPCTTYLFFRPCDEGCTPEFWSCHTALWDGIGPDDVTTVVKTTNRFNEFFGVSRPESKLRDDVTLVGAFDLKGNGWRTLACQAAAAAANADAGMNYPLRLDEVVEVYRQAVVGNRSSEDARAALDILSAANELACPFE